MLGIPARDDARAAGRIVATSSAALLPQWAERLGLDAGTPIIAGGVDAAVATFAAGVTRAGQHVAMIGTSMCWGYINQHVDARHGLVSMPHVFNGRSDIYMFGGAITRGRLGHVVSRAVLPRGDRGGARRRRTAIRIGCSKKPRRACRQVRTAWCSCPT